MSPTKTQQKALTPSDIARVSGAAFIPVPLPPGELRPPVYTTQAIGEDGGYPPTLA